MIKTGTCHNKMQIAYSILLSFDSGKSRKTEIPKINVKLAHTFDHMYIRIINFLCKEHM